MSVGVRILTRFPGGAERECGQPNYILNKWEKPFLRLQTESCFFHQALSSHLFSSFVSKKEYSCPVAPFPIVSQYEDSQCSLGVDSELPLHKLVSQRFLMHFCTTSFHQVFPFSKPLEHPHVKTPGAHWLPLVMGNQTEQAYWEEMRINPLGWVVTCYNALRLASTLSGPIWMLSSCSHHP